MENKNLAIDIGDTKNNEISFGHFILVVVSVILGSLLTVWVSCDYVNSQISLAIEKNKVEQENTWNTQRQKCNSTVLSDGKLSEEMDFALFGVDDKDTVKNAMAKNKILEYKLTQTNKEVNTLRNLFACYFDK